MQSTFGMLTTALAVPFVLGGAPLSRPPQDKPPDPPAPAKTVRGLGCVEAGVEASCLVLRDTKTDKLYNLYFSMPGKPQPGMGIRFQGTRKDGVTICMQGEPINVDSWSRAELACSGHDRGDK
jgi:hypothetical protein